MIEIRNLMKYHGDNIVLKHVDLSVEKGEILGIIGRSGAGKSTLLRCVNGLESYDKGSINIYGREINTLNKADMRVLRKKVGMIFQNFNLMDRENIFNNVALPLKIWGYKKDYINKRVMELLRLVGIEDKLDSMPRNLSGGEKQRVAIARALALEPEVLLCDEATSALDPKTTKSILNLLREINEKFHITILMVTHQMEVIKQICGTVVVMECGEIKTTDTVEKLFLKPNVVLKKFMGEEELVCEKGVNIKIFFPSNLSGKSIITSIARELDVDFSIVYGKLEKFRNEVIGSLSINVKKEEYEEIIQQITKRGLEWEVDR